MQTWDDLFQALPIQLPANDIVAMVADCQDRDAAPTGNVVWHSPSISRSQRAEKNAHRAAVVWLTGLPGAGKSTIAHAAEATPLAADLVLDTRADSIEESVRRLSRLLLASLARVTSIDPAVSGSDPASRPLPLSSPKPAAP